MNEPPLKALRIYRGLQNPCPQKPSSSCPYPMFQGPKVLLTRILTLKQQTFLNLTFKCPLIPVTPSDLQSALQLCVLSTAKDECFFVSYQKGFLALTFSLYYLLITSCFSCSLRYQYNLAVSSQLHCRRRHFSPDLSNT